MDRTIVLMLELSKLLPVVLHELRKIVIHLHIRRSRVHLCNLRPRVHTVELYDLLSDLMDRVTVDTHSRLCFSSDCYKRLQFLALVREAFELRLHL